MLFVIQITFGLKYSLRWFNAKLLKTANICGCKMDTLKQLRQVLSVSPSAFVMVIMAFLLEQKKRHYIAKRVQLEAELNYATVSQRSSWQSSEHVCTILAQAPRKRVCAFDLIFQY